MAFASPEQPKIYESLGKCIYCGRGSEEGATLTKEHIIPAAFKGSLQIRDGSCLACADVIKRFEQDCARNFFGAFREYRGMKSNRHKKDDRRIPVVVWKSPGVKEINWHEPHEFPDVLFFSQFLHSPYVLQGLTESGTPAMAALVLPREGFDLTPFIGKTAGQFDPHKYACLVAKIAHGYATARLGFGSFKPLALELILGQTMNWPAIVGGNRTVPPAEKESVHALRLDPYFDETRRKQFIVATVRLFAGYGAPIYAVAVGELPYESRLLLDLESEIELKNK